MPNGTAEDGREPTAARETAEAAPDTQPPREEVETGAHEPTGEEKSANESRPQMEESENSSPQPVACGENAEIVTQQPVRAVEKAATDPDQPRRSDPGHQPADEKLQADQPQAR